jgi:hypothetical protein
MRGLLLRRLPCGVVRPWWELAECRVPYVQGCWVIAGTCSMSDFEPRMRSAGLERDTFVPL